MILTNTEKDIARLNAIDELGLAAVVSQARGYHIAKSMANKVKFEEPEWDSLRTLVDEAMIHCGWTFEELLRSPMRASIHSEDLRLTKTYHSPIKN